MPNGARQPARKRARADGNRTHILYSVDVALEICVRLAARERWRAICSRGRLPSYTALYGWQDKHPAFAEALAQAREIALERGGPLAPEDLEHLKGLLMASKPGPRLGTGAGQLRPRRDGKVVHVRYGAAVSQEICERLAKGESWKDFAGSARMPCYRTLYHWIEKHPEFAEAVARARRIAGEARFELALEMAMAATPATVQADKLKVATLLHHAERLDPERFGRAGGRGGEAEQGRVRRITVRRFERAWREDGTAYVKAIDSVQDVEDRR